MREKYSKGKISIRNILENILIIYVIALELKYKLSKKSYYLMILNFSFFMFILHENSIKKVKLPYEIFLKKFS